MLGTLTTGGQTVTQAQRGASLHPTPNPKLSFPLFPRDSGVRLLALELWVFHLLVKWLWGSYLTLSVLQCSAVK